MHPTPTRLSYVISRWIEKSLHHIPGSWVSTIDQLFAFAIQTVSVDFHPPSKRVRRDQSSSSSCKDFSTALSVSCDLSYGFVLTPPSPQ